MSAVVLTRVRPWRRARRIDPEQPPRSGLERVEDQLAAVACEPAHLAGLLEGLRETVKLSGRKAG